MALNRITKIGNIVLDYKMYEKEQNEKSDILTEVAVSESGVHLIWQNVLKTPYITVVSGENGWMTELTKDAIMVLRGQLETTLSITYEDLTTEDVRFAHENNNGAIFAPLFEGSDRYTAELFFAKVII